MRERIMLLLAVVFWGFSFVFTKILLDYVTPLELMGLRFIIGLPFLYLVLRKKKIQLQFEKKDYSKILLGGLIITVHFFIQMTGLKYTSATNTGWIISVTPLVLALLSYFFLKEKIGRNAILGIVIATTGIILLVSKGELSKVDWLSSVGDWLVLLSAHTWAIYTVITRDISRRYNPIAVTFAMFIPATIITVGYMLFDSDWTVFVNLPTEPMIALGILGILCLAVSHWFWQEGVAKFGAAKAGFFLYLEPLATTALAVPYLNEQCGIFTAVGGMLVLSGVFLSSKNNGLHFLYNLSVFVRNNLFTMEESNRLKWFLKTALVYLGTPYKWGGDDPSGFDCSGYVLECLKTVGLCSENDDFTADSLLKHFSDKQELDRPEKGALLFHLNENSKAYHLVICLDESFQIGASGGDSQTTDRDKAWEQNGYVKIRPIKLRPQKTKIIRIIA